MINFRNLILIFFFLFSSGAFAQGAGGTGNDKGSGGDVLVCDAKPESTRSVELFDFYEGRALRRLKVEPIDGDTYGWLSALADRLRKFDPDAFSNFLTHAAELQRAFTDARKGRASERKNFLFTTDELYDVRDSRELLVGPDCKITQIVVQSKTGIDEDPRYIVRVDLLRSLSNEDVLGLVVHEALYRSFIDSYGVVDSVHVRYLNQIIASKGPHALEFWDLVRAVRGSTVNSVISKGKLARYALHSLKLLPDGYVLAQLYNRDTVLAVDRNGAPDFEKSVEHGGVLVSHYSPLMDDLYRIEIKHSKHESVMELKSSEKLLIPFGVSSIAVTATVHDSEYLKPTGFIFDEDYASKKLLVPVITSLERSGSDVQEFILRLDPSFEVTLKVL